MSQSEDRTADAPVRGLVSWIRNEALPTWSVQGFDAGAGRFHERLDGNGLPLQVPYRAMVQARQIYVYAHASRLGWHTGGVEQATRAMTSLQRDFCVEADGVIAVRFSIDPATGQPVSDLLDAYTHAFVLFAAAFLHQATGEASLLDFARKVAGFVDLRLADPVNGGVLTHAGSMDAEKLQNPQMHLLEAWLALAEADPDGPWLDRAGSLVTLFRDYMMQRQKNILPERFAVNWAQHQDRAVADIFEPGHHFEWIWLLQWYEQLTGVELNDVRAALLRTATQPAASANGLLVDQLGGDGRVVRGTHRLWPHCEAIKAAMVSSGHLGGSGAADLANAAATALLDNFIGRPFPGGWIDQITPAREPIVDYVPASSLYHLTLAAAVAQQSALSMKMS